MSAEPRVTVVIPTRDRASWLAESMASVLASSYADFVLLVADNASSDATPAVVAAVDDPRVQYLRRSEDLGMVGNFNDALDRVTTEYVWVLSDDDLLLPDALAAAVEALDRFPSAGMAHGRFDTIDGEGVVLARGLDSTRDLRRDTLEPAREHLRKSMRMGSRVLAPAALLRMAALEGLRYDPDEYPVFDFGLDLRMSLRWDFAFLDRSMIQYRVHPGSGSIEYGWVAGSGYVFGPELLDKLHSVKARFLDEHGPQLGPETEHLAGLLAAGDRDELLVRTKHATLPDRRVGDTVRALATAVRQDHGVVLAGGAWRMLGGSLAGPSNRARIRRLLHR